MGPKIGKRALAVADKEAASVMNAMSTVVSEADNVELNYVMARLKENKNLLFRFSPKCSAHVHLMHYMLHVSQPC
jgi:hypothetical protein